MPVGICQKVAPTLGTLAVRSALSIAAFTLNSAALADHSSLPIYVPADYPTIQSAIDAAPDGSEIYVDDGTWTGAENRNIDFGGKTLSLRSLNGAEFCTIDCNSMGRAFDLSAGSAGNIYGFTIRQGLAATDGGGALVRTGTEFGFHDCRFQDCHAPDGCGGAIASDDPGTRVYIIDCVIRECSAGTCGGGVWIGRGEAFGMTGTTLADNEADDHGGGLSVSNLFYGYQIDRCVFSGNSTAAFGGGLYVEGEYSGIISRCRFDRNLARDILADTGSGGGAYITLGARIAFENIEWHGNVALHAGGGLFVHLDGTVILDNGVFSGNVADTGGGAFLGGTAYSSIRSSTFASNAGRGLVLDGPAGVHNCVLVENTNPTGTIESRQLAVAVSGVLDLQYSCVQGLSGGLGGSGNISGDPKFVNRLGVDGLPGTTDDDLRLSAGSDCIDAGNTLLLGDDWGDLDDDGLVGDELPVDVDETDRTVDDSFTPDTGTPDAAGVVVDMGAFEFHAWVWTPDLDGDGHVDGADLGILLGLWGKAGAGDSNGDGTVDGADLGALLGGWTN